MSTPRARHIPQLLDTHAEDLAFLWAQRRMVLDSAEHTLRDFAHLTERIEAHVQGLLVAPTPALRQRLEVALGGGERDDIFAAAIAVLRCEDAAAVRWVLAEFSRAAGPTLDGLRDAMGQAPAALVGEELRQALARAKPATAAAAATALANLRLLNPEAPGLARLLVEDEAAACALGWRAATRADCLGAAPSAARPHREALARPEPAVRHAAWASAAWLGHAPLWVQLRRSVAEGDAVATHWLCVLGAPEDSKALGTAVMALPEPDQRCAALARFGHPAALPTLVRWMEGEDAVTAHAAGLAFTRITGAEIQGERRTLPVPDDADEIDREMAPLVWTPDIAKARRLLEEQGAQWSTATRWCAGRRMDMAFAADDLAALDLQARWDVAARAALAGRPVSAPPPIV
ncbi:MAG: hypothetical protein JNN03_01825 [Rubrivivax sp.]|nr:hypothetical protein [Rubrivivax sp.]